MTTESERKYGRAPYMGRMEKRLKAAGIKWAAYKEPYAAPVSRDEEFAARMAAYDEYIVAVWGVISEFWRRTW